MVEMKHTRTFDKVKTPEAVLKAVRDWARGTDLSIEDQSIIKVIASKAKIDDLEARLKPIQEAEAAAAKPASEAETAEA